MVGIRYQWINHHANQETMKPDCILFYGNATQHGNKYAGTFRIASELRLNGYTVQTIDLIPFKGLDDNLKEILRNLITSKTLWIGISTTFLHEIFGFPYYRSQKTFDIRFADKPEITAQIKEFVNFVKELNPKTKLIAGGSRKFMIEQFGFKVFKSYSDSEIVDFTRWCEGKNPTPRLDFFGTNIEGSEYEQFHTSQIVFTPEDIITKGESVPLEVSRGCIFKCKFCSFPMNGKTKGEWVKQSSVLREELLRNYNEHGVTEYTFSDDTYNDSVDKVKRLHDEVFSTLPFKINFTSYIRLDLMIRFPETIEYLVNSGLKSAVFGIETINHESGKIIGKGLDPMVQFQFIEELKKKEWKDVMTFSGFIMGLPRDTHDGLAEFEEFVFSDKNKLDWCQVASLSIMPPTVENVTRNAYSEFDIEYEKYGYECIEDIGDNPFTEIKWNNKNTGLTSEITQSFSDRLNKKMLMSDKFKFGGFLYPYMKTLGITNQDLFTLSIPQIRAKYNITELRNQSHELYRSKLLTISTSI
jgi:hypothetical protein